MKRIKLIVCNLVYAALPMPDGSFDIFHEEHHLGKISPIINDDTSISWVSADLISTALAQKIGEAIEELEL